MKGDAAGEWRVDVKGYPVTVIGKYAHDHVSQAVLEMARMKMALHRILHMDPKEWGAQGIYHAQNLAREGLQVDAYGRHET